MFVEVAETAVAALKLYDERQTIGKIARRWIYQIHHGTSHVVVFGAGGTGKSTLGRFLQGKLDTDAGAGQYEETIEIERIRVAGSIPAVLAIAPGQRSRQASTWPELFAELYEHGASPRVINVVSDGYHTTGIERSAHRVYDPQSSEDEFRARYLDDSKTVEIEALQTLAPHLASAPGKLRMVTLVTKQDLWWNKRHKIKENYESGSYGAEINKIKMQRGAAYFHHEYMSCALIEQNLSMADGFSIAQTVSGYDDILRVSNLRRVASAIEQIVKA